MRFAVHRHEGNGGDLWLYDPDQGGMGRWTFDISQENSSPVWSPEGDRIAFASRRDGQWGIWVKNVDLTGSETMLVSGDRPLAPMSWAPNGEIVYSVLGPPSPDIWAVDSSAQSDARPVFDTPDVEAFPQVSPDGNWIAYMKLDDAGNAQIWVDSFPEPQGNRGQITTAGANWPRWGPEDGETLELFFGSGNDGMARMPLRVAGAAIQPAGPQQPMFPFGNPNLRGSSHYNVNGSYTRYAVSADGRRFLIPQPAGSPATEDGGSGGAAPIADFIRNNTNTADGNSSTPPVNEIAVVTDWTRLLPVE